MHKLAFALAAVSLVAPPLSRAADDATERYQVARGDTLIGIRDRLLVPGSDWRVLQKINRVADPYRLRPGRTLLLPRALLRQQPAVAEVLHVFGDVKVARAGGAPERLAAASTVAAGDVVRTGAQSSATLRFADGSRLLVRPDSELKLERLTRGADGRESNTELGLQRGAVDSTVEPARAGARSAPKRYEIRSPIANLGVRGTEFRARIDEGRLRVEVLEGRVGASQRGRETAVAAGFGAVAAAGVAPAVRELLAAPQLDAVPARIERLPLALKWAALPGAQNYRSQVFESSGAGTLVADATTVQPAASYGEDLPDGRYTLRLRGIDAQGLEGRDASTSFVLKARPEPPFLQQPATAARLYDENVAFVWTRSRDAARYRLQIADNPDFAALRIDRSDIAGPSQTVPLPLGHHYWRVASVRADGDQGPFGDAQVLVRREPPPPPAPAEAQVTDTGLALRWRAAEERDARFAWQLAGPGGFDAPLRQGTSSAPLLVLDELSAGTYTLRVRTLNSDGIAGPWGAPQEIEVPRSKWWWLLAVPLLLLL